MNDETVRTLLVIVNYIMPMIICTSLIIMLIINSFLIGNIRDKEENVDNIREYSLIRLLITGIILIVVMRLILIPKTMSSAIMPDKEQLEIAQRYLVFESVLCLIYIAVIVPQILVIRNLRRYLDGKEVEEFKNKEEVSSSRITILKTCTIIVYVIIALEAIF